MIRFADPLFFLLFFLFIPLILSAQKTGGRIQYSSLAPFKVSADAFGMQKAFNPRFFLLVLRLLTLFLFIVAMARPQSGKKFTEVASEGVDIILALDTSGSMQALDFRDENNEPTDRLSIVKNVVADFVKNRPSDRLGLVVFGEQAFTQCPLTLDHGVVLEFLKNIELGMAGDATAIGEAIGTAINRIKDLKAKSKVIILLTDGRNNAGRIPPEKAAELAETFKIKVYTIGVGTHGKAPFLVDSFFGKQYIYRDVDIDEDILKLIAQKSGGRYFRATDKRELENIYTEIDRLEKTEIKMKEYTEFNEMFHWFLLPGLLLLLVEVVLGQTRWRKIP